MFILRRITSEGKEGNQIMGDHYSTILSRHKESSHEFNMLVEPWPNPEEIFGFIAYREGEKVLPLYKKSAYYLMCSDGKTFDKITYKQ